MEDAREYSTIRPLRDGVIADSFAAEQNDNAFDQND